MLTSILKTLAAFVVVLEVGKGAPRKETLPCLKYYDGYSLTLVYYDAGKQGPCGKDQIFLLIPDAFNKTLLKGGARGSDYAFLAGELNVLDRINHTNLSNDQTNSDNNDCQEGYCVWNSTQHPCHGLPANQRYSNETQLCHTLGSQEYCPNNQIFYVQLEEGLDTLYGDCDCNALKKLWFDPNDRNCYAPFSQGSCLDSQWLTINKTTGRVECEPAPCPNDGRHVYWTTGFSRCYLLGDVGPCDYKYKQRLSVELGVVRCKSPSSRFGGSGSGFASFSPTRKNSSLLTMKISKQWGTCQKEGSKQSQTSPTCRWIPRIASNQCGIGTFSSSLRRCTRTRTLRTYSN